jgi:hypothetical protein
MRSVAAKVRNIFGLDKFSHSTLSRTLKKLSGIVEDLFGIMADDIILTFCVILPGGNVKSMDNLHVFFSPS